jgi:hypothetical protein
VRCNLADQWDRPELGERGLTPSGEFRVFNVFVPADPGDPQAYLVRSFSEHATVGSHFHEHPQFQVFAEGDGTFQRHKVAAFTVHFTDAYSVYGPIIAGDQGLSFFVLRAELDGGAHYMPGARDRLINRGRRNLSVVVDQERLRNEGVVTLFADDDGLFGEVCRGVAGESIALPDVSGSPGCYTLVLEGSATTDATVLARHSVIHRADGDQPMNLVAAADGASVLSLRFPQASVEAVGA